MLFEIIWDGFVGKYFSPLGLIVREDLFMKFYEHGEDFRLLVDEILYYNIFN